MSLKTPLDSQIASNRRRTFVLFVSFGLLYSIPLALIVVSSRGWPIGPNPTALLIGLGILAASLCIAIIRVERIVIGMTDAQEVKSRSSRPELWDAVESMSLAAGIPMPKVYVIYDPTPNAFAAGRKQESAIVCVTLGLLRTMNKMELEGVIAHEIAHIRNRDTKLMTYATALVWGITMIAQVLVFALTIVAIFSMASTQRRDKDGNSDPSGLISWLGALIAIFVIQIFVLTTNLVHLAISRQREFQADASAVELTKYPAGLIAALEKINAYTPPGQNRQGRVAALRERLRLSKEVSIAHLYISPIRSRDGLVSRLTSTHPPTVKRISRLLEILVG